MKTLIELQNNPEQRDALKALAYEILAKLAADAALRGDSTAGFKDAKNTLDAVFTELDKKYVK